MLAFRIYREERGLGVRRVCFAGVGPVGPVFYLCFPCVTCEHASFEDKVRALRIDRKYHRLGVRNLRFSCVGTVGPARPVFSLCSTCVTCVGALYGLIFLQFILDIGRGK